MTASIFRAPSPSELGLKNLHARERQSSPQVKWQALGSLSPHLHRHMGSLMGDPGGDLKWQWYLSRFHRDHALAERAPGRKSAHMPER